MKCPKCGNELKDSLKYCDVCCTKQVTPSNKEVKAGETCIVVRDIVIDGQTIFDKAERIVVEQIVPNPQRPKYKYVVNSPAVGKRFQLSDGDISAYPVVSHTGVETKSVDRPLKGGILAKAAGLIREHRVGSLIAGGVAVSVCIIVILVLVFTNSSSGAAQALDTYIKFCSEHDLQAVSEMQGVVSQITSNKVAEEMDVTRNYGGETVDEIACNYFNVYADWKIGETKSVPAEGQSSEYGVDKIVVITITQISTGETHKMMLARERGIWKVQTPFPIDDSSSD